MSTINKPQSISSTNYHLTTRRFLLRPNWYVEDLLCALQIGIAHFLLVFFTYAYVPDPYMDEIFHIDQTRRYAKGDFRWDPKITTPPALYLLGIPLSSFKLERFLNTALLMLFYIGCCRYRRLFTRSTIKLTSFTICLLPVLLHTSVLFYTDILSVCCVIWAFTLSTSNAAVCFFIAICARQNNIVWAGLYALVRMYHHFDDARPVYSVYKSVMKLWPFLVLAAGFLVFIVVNGGIVLGDPSAHQVKPHFAQVLYFLAFCGIHAAPQSLPYLGEIVSSCLSTFYLFLCGIFFVFVRNFTYTHPYNLADNRHVFFTIWNRLLKDEKMRLVAVPLYAAAAIFVLKLSSSTPKFVSFLFACTTIAVIVPAHLVEPRYFIIPYLLWRLSSCPPTIKCIAVFEILLNLFIFLAVYIRFIAFPYEFPHEPGVLQRYMW